MCRNTESSRCRAAVRQSHHRVVTLIAIVTLVCFGHAQAQTQKPSVEEELAVHRLVAETTSPYDAFAYLNRIPTELGEGETAVDFGGTVIFSRLANQEGRVELKIVEGFNRSAYLGYKAFMRAWSEKGAAVGNCVVCHTPPAFTDGKKYIVDESGVAKVVPSLRNLEKSDKDVEAILQRKVKMADMARANDEGDIDEAYKIIRLSESDVKDLVQFMGSLNEISKEGFRDLILNAEILDTTDMLN